MDIAIEIHTKLEKILNRLKVLGVIETFKLEVSFCQIEDDLRTSLVEIDSILKRCLHKIINKPRRAEIRNVITELVRKKNLSDISPNEGVCLAREQSMKTQHIEQKPEDVVRHVFAGDLAPQKESIAHKKIQKSLKEQIPEQQLKIRLEKQVPTAKQKEFICACGKVFRLLKSLRKHENVKHSAKNIKYDCTICKKSFSERGKLNRHMLSHKVGQHDCSFCSKRFARSDSLKRHLSLVHYSSEEFFCSFCHKKFNLKYNKDVHEENFHRNANNWIQCEKCGQKCRNKITFKSHLKTHSNDRIICEVCSKSFVRKIQYRNHMKNKHIGTSPRQSLVTEEPKT